MIEWLLAGGFAVVLLVLMFVGLLILAYVVYVYNKLVKLDQNIKNAFAQISVQLKMRADLVPNLVETVKGYAKHEKTVFENVTKARAAIMKAKTPAEMAKADDMLTGALKSLFAVAENYPRLQANQNFLQLQEKLGELEQKIAYARQSYNDTITMYNRLVLYFPSNIIANMLGHKEKEYFEVGEKERAAPKVKF
ncbi:MAG: LemA family protein [Candidatus Anstonellales archaeon]